MDIFTLLVGGALSLGLLYLVMKLSRTIFTNVIIGMQFRRRLAQQLQRLRLNRMLIILGIQPNQYLHSESVIDIEKQMSKCAACDNTEDCDDHFSRGHVNTENIDYCDNREELTRIVGHQQGTHTLKS